MNPNKQMFNFDGGEEYSKLVSKLYKELDIKKRTFNVIISQIDRLVDKPLKAKNLKPKYAIHLENRRSEMVKAYRLNECLEEIQEDENQIADIIVMFTGDSKDFLSGISPGRKGIEEVVEIGRGYFFEPTTKGVS